MTDREDLAILAGGSPLEDRETRLTEGADQLAERARSSILGHERFLLWLSAALTTLGLSVILLGWAGASRSTLVEEQIPYLISGGLFGLALALIGAVTLFAHWLTVLIRENRQREISRRSDHAELMEAVRSLHASFTPQESTNGRTRGKRTDRPLRSARRG